MVIQAEAEPQWRLVTGLSWCQYPISALLVTAWPPPVPLVCRHVQRRRSSSSTSQRSAPHGRCVPPLHRYSLPPYQPLPAIASPPTRCRFVTRSGVAHHQSPFVSISAPSSTSGFTASKPAPLCAVTSCGLPACTPGSSRFAPYACTAHHSFAAEGRVVTITVNALTTLHTGALSSILAAHQAPKPYRTCRSAQRQQRPGTRCERQATYRG